MLSNMLTLIARLHGWEFTRVSAEKMTIEQRTAEFRGFDSRRTHVKHTLHRCMSEQDESNSNITAHAYALLCCRSTQHDYPS